MAIKERIKILHLEDDPRDAALIQRMLAGAGLVCECRVVDDAAGFESALAGERFGLILCDYNLPGYDGVSALTLAQAKQPEAPVIVISGSIGEDIAVKCLQLGATDYLLKQRLDRLVSAVKRALEGAAEHRERLKAETELRATKDTLEAIFNAAPVAILALDLEGRITSWNAGAERMFGWTREEARGRICPTVPEDGMEAFKAMIQRTVSAGPQTGLVYDRQKKTGDRMRAGISTAPLCDAAGQPVGILAILEDITARVRAEEALRESEERFRSLAEHSDEIFWFLSVAPEQVLFVSPSVEKTWGLPAERFYQESRAWVAAIHADDRPRVQQHWEAFLQGRSHRFDAEYRVVRPDGAIRWVLDSGTPVRSEAGVIVRLGGVAKDISERKQVERQVLRAQRLEAIGTLASGVAHDLNNVLAPITMSVELLKMDYPTQSSLTEIIETNARRGADMVRQLLTFCRGVEGERILIHPGHLMKEMKKLMQGTFPKNLQLEVKYDPQLPMVRGDATQLHQVLLNFCVNARDAMPNGGRLALEAESVEVDAAYASAVPDAKPGKYVTLRVSDSGTGIPPEILDHIFEPFFTTKSLDKGTGLGLSTVLGIVKSHGGFVQVYSKPGHGSTFTAYLPADAGVEDDAGLRTNGETAFRGNGETILFVDDEAPIREMVRAVLKRMNLKLLTATDGADGVIQPAQHRRAIRGIITDQHMPHMDGMAFLRVVRRMLPDTPIAVASGRMEDAVAEEFRSLGVTMRLDKPFTQVQLVEVLKNFLTPK